MNLECLPFEEGDDRGSFPIFGNLRQYKERLNRIVIGVATNSADHFEKRRSRMSSPADLSGARVCSSFRTAAIWIWVKEKWWGLGRVAVEGAGQLTGVARWKAWPAVEKLPTSTVYIQCLAKVFGPLELCDLLPHFRLQT